MANSHGRQLLTAKWKVLAQERPEVSPRRLEHQLIKGVLVFHALTKLISLKTRLLTQQTGNVHCEMVGYTQEGAEVIQHSIQGS